MAWTNFVAGTTAVAADVNADFDYFQTNVLPQDSSGTSTDSTYTLGNSSYQWSGVYADKFYFSANTYLDFDGSDVVLYKNGIEVSRW